MSTSQRAASGVMPVARDAAVVPRMAGAALAAPALSLPFLPGGRLELIYDGALFLLFRGVRPPEEADRANHGSSWHTR